MPRIPQTLLYACTLIFFAPPVMAGEADTCARALAGKLCLTGVPQDEQLSALKLAPRGAAMRLPAPEGLAKKGVESLILIVGASSRREGEAFDPTLPLLRIGLENAFQVAREAGYDRVAIPFLARGGLLKRMDASKEDLAIALLETSAKTAALKVTFILSGWNEVNRFRAIIDRLGASHVKAIKASAGNKDAHKSKVLIDTMDMELSPLEEASDDGADSPLPGEPAPAAGAEPPRPN